MEQNKGLSTMATSAKEFTGTRARTSRIGLMASTALVSALLTGASVQAQAPDSVIPDLTGVLVGIGEFANATDRNLGADPGNATLNEVLVDTGGRLMTFSANGAGNIVSSNGVGAESLESINIRATSSFLANGAGTGIIDLTGTTITNAGTVNISDGQTLRVDALTNSVGGVVNINDAGTLDAVGNTINNGATINVGTNGALTDAGSINNLATGIINFNGVGGTATFTAGSGTIANRGAINLVGTGAVNATGNLVNLDTGTLSVTGGDLTLSGVLINSSTSATAVVIGAGRTVTP